MDRSKRRNRPSVQKSGAAAVIKAVLTSAVITMMAMLAAALLLKNQVISTETVSVFNQVLKVLGIALASWLSVRGGAEHPWFRGLLSGFCYIVAGVILISLFAGSFGLNTGTLLDALMAAALGAAVGFLLGKKPATQ